MTSYYPKKYHLTKAVLFHRPVPAFDTEQNHPVVADSGSLLYNQTAVEDLLALPDIFRIDLRVG